MRFVAEMLSGAGSAGCDVRSDGFWRGFDHTITVSKSEAECCIDVRPSNKCLAAHADWFRRRKARRCKGKGKRKGKGTGRCSHRAKWVRPEHFQMRPVAQLALHSGAGHVVADFAQSAGGVTLSFSVEGVGPLKVYIYIYMYNTCVYIYIYIYT